MSMTAHNIPTDVKNAAPNSHQDHFSNQNIQVFSWALDVPIISLNNPLFLVWLPDYYSLTICGEVFYHQRFNCQSHFNSSSS